VDPGPSTTLPRLRGELARRGIGPGDLRFLLLTHVHLDHAGAAGHLAREHPHLVVHVHADGAPHLADPTKLVASTRRTFGHRHDELWGEVLPVPGHRLRPWHPDAGEASPLPAGVEAIPTPGHIGHHLAWHLPGESTVLCGDALGILLHPDAPSHPATPPPAVDLKAWGTTLRHLMMRDDIKRFGVSHYGWHDDLRTRSVELVGALTSLAARVRREQGGADPEGAPGRYESEVRHRLAGWLPREWVDRYFDGFTATSDWEGVRFHLQRTDWPGIL
jgi:glyoxylase-like metal-dependent hydrolase (beta-lactamase superfamily II)